MTKILSGAAIEDILDVVTYENMSVRNDYSGRCMYGETCFGIVYDYDGTLAKVSARLNSDDSRDLWVKLMNNASYDSMGLGSIIYFRNYKVDEETFTRYDDSDSDYYEDVEDEEDE